MKKKYLFQFILVLLGLNDLLAQERLLIDVYEYNYGTHLYLFDDSTYEFKFHNSPIEDFYKDEGKYRLRKSGIILNSIKPVQIINKINSQGVRDSILSGYLFKNKFYPIRNNILDMSDGRTTELGYPAWQFYRWSNEKVKEKATFYQEVEYERSKGLLILPNDKRIKSDFRFNRSCFKKSNYDEDNYRFNLNYRYEKNLTLIFKGEKVDPFEDTSGVFVDSIIYKDNYPVKFNSNFFIYPEETIYFSDTLIHYVGFVSYSETEVYSHEINIYPEYPYFFDSERFLFISLLPLDSMTNFHFYVFDYYHFEHLLMKVESIVIKNMESLNKLIFEVNIVTDREERIVLNIDKETRQLIRLAKEHLWDKEHTYVSDYKVELDTCLSINKTKVFRDREIKTGEKFVFSEIIETDIWNPNIINLDEAQNKLTDLVLFLNTHKDTKLFIAGNFFATNGKENPDMNTQYSEKEKKKKGIPKEIKTYKDFAIARAKSVYDLLIEMGVNKEQLTVGFGNSYSDKEIGVSISFEITVSN